LIVRVAEETLDQSSYPNLPATNLTLRIVAVAVLVVAFAQAAFIGLFAAMSLSGDSLGIARAMALILAVPFLVFTVPALVLLRRGRPDLAGCVVALSAAAMYVAWRFA
jgi:hypothetical protein